MAPLFIGIDIGKFQHEAAAVTDAGAVLRTWRFDNTQAGFGHLWDTVQRLATDQAVVFGLEATGHYWLPLYAALTARAATVQVINPLQSGSLRQLYLRVTKTDRKDAFLIAEVLRMGRYTTTTVPEDTLLALRDLAAPRRIYPDAGDPQVPMAHGHGPDLSGVAPLVEQPLRGDRPGHSEPISHPRGPGRRRSGDVDGAHLDH